MIGLDLDIDADIGRARTPHPRLYLDDESWMLMRERVFARSWQWLGDLDNVASPSSLTPLPLLPGLLDEPLLLSRDGAGCLRLLSNVCTHRASLLVDRPCSSAHIRCPYHGRRFELDGRMTHGPGFEATPGFPTAADDLPQLPLAHWGPLAFGALAPAAPFEQVFGDAKARLAWLPWDEFVRDPTRDRDYSFDAHWALYVENYLEGLHIPFLHPGLARTLALGGYRDELFPASTLQLAPARVGEAAFDMPPSSPDLGQRIAAYYWWLWPNLMLNFYPWGLSLNLVLPQGPARTRVQFRAWVRDPELLGSGAGGALDTVEQEDETAVERVQRGLRSRLAGRGRYSPTQEQGLHHFHRLLAAALAAP